MSTLMIPGMRLMNRDKDSSRFCVFSVRVEAAKLVHGDWFLGLL